MRQASGKKTKQEKRLVFNTHTLFWIFSAFCSSYDVAPGRNRETDVYKSDREHTSNHNFLCASDAPLFLLTFSATDK